MAVRLRRAVRWFSERLNIRNVGFALVALVVFLLILVGYQLAWTGFSDKSLWDWMKLLIVPAVLSFGALLLSQRRDRTERAILSERVRESAIQMYLDRMTELILDKELRTSEDSEVREVARARTLTVLRELDAIRKGIILRFLCDSGLIKRDKEVIRLSNADINNVHLRGAYLEGVHLRRANLAGADLSQANLNGASLFNANLRNANLASVFLWQAEVSGVNLSGAKLHCAMLSEAALVDADLSGADLRSANLFKANLSGANLQGANLRDCRLRDANLSNTKVTDKQLLLVESLIGATMPGGNRYDGRFNLVYEINYAREDCGLDPTDLEAMARLYEVPLEEYQRGQQWARGNLETKRRK